MLDRVVRCVLFVILILFRVHQYLLRIVKFSDNDYSSLMYMCLHF